VDEEKKVAAGTPGGRRLPKRIFNWLDRRAGLDKLMKESLDEPIPGGARLAYVFGSGLLFIFISQIITGICLALYYVPSAETAHTSVAYITKQVAAGAFLRSLHYYGSSAMIIVLALHFLQTFLYGSFKGRRELLWMSGAVLSFLVLGMGFTGYLLPWDQKAYFATAVGTNIVGQIPLVGNWLTRLLRGGDTIGTLTLSRFYVAHVFLIPGAIFAFIAAHIFLFRKAGAAGPINEDPVDPKLAPQGFYPRQVLMDMALALLLMIGLGFLSYFHPTGLGPIANPADTQFLPRPEWYYLPMFEWLKYWEGPKVVFAVVVIPGLLAMLFFLMPFLDRRLERRPWRRPIPVLAVAFVMLGIIYLGAKSEWDDQHDPTVASRLSTQDQQEKAYTAAAFEPYVESPGGTGPMALPTGPVNPLVAQGKGIFEAHGCAGCHGATGMGTSAAPGLAGITTKFPEAQLIALLHNPNAKMRAGHMPAVDISTGDMSHLLAYLGVLGTSAANVQAASGVSAEPSAGGNEAAASARGKNGATPVSEGGASTKLSASAAAGQQMFQDRGCFACHGQAGVGGKAPPLAPLIKNASDAQLEQLLQSPNAKMKAGEMQPVAGTPEELGSIVAYLRTLGTPQPGKQAAAPNAAMNAVSPPETTPAPNASAAAAPAPSAGTPTGVAGEKPVAGQALFVSQGCAACHGPTAQGTHFAPSLIGIGKKFPGDALPTLLHHPTSKMRNGGMPAVKVNDAQMVQLVAYLSSLAPSPAGTPSAPANQVVGAPGAQPTPVASGANHPVTAQAAAPVALSPLALRGQHVFQNNRCETCHGVGGLQGTVAAPGLAGTASILSASVLEDLLRHHSVKMQQGGMPLTNMNTQDMKALVAFIRSIPADGQ
jgi:quinol-cytochrome oxidoreductase complex cytochrome b subunit/mono/diheme cytochrome c family protein